jgi:isopentenyl-diphosphate delta-isomerase
MANGISELQGYDEEQKEMMKENCIVVDENDQIIGQESKINCHRDKGILHRAFSVLLFNSENELLIQQRAGEKITFPSVWANSCCSHPLYQNGEECGIEGAKKAAIRKLEQELGTYKDSVNPEDLTFISKMHYKARADRKWIEHEVDYIFVIKGNISINPNPNEIQKTQYVNKEKLDLLFEKSTKDDIKIGPWFRLIRDNFLDNIWENLDELNRIQDNKVHHMEELQ